MNYTRFSPSKQLSELVQCFWALESNPHETTPGEYFLMADGCLEIIFQYSGGFKQYSKQSARIRFQHSTYNKFVVEKELGFFGVRLYPHVANQLFGMPANEVSNIVFDFPTLFKQKGRDLSDQIYYSKNTSERVAWVSDFLLKGATNKKTDPIHHLVNQIIECDGQIDLSHLHQKSGLSVKQFERRFKAVAGFAPKYFTRVARFQGAKQKYLSSKIKTLTELAYLCNYYDQSHFIREFKEFSGIQPLQYFKFKNTENVNTCPPLAGTQSEFDGHLPCGWFV